MRIRDLRFALKQWIGFDAILLIMAAVSFVSIFQMNRLRAEIDELNEYWIPGILALSEINLDVSVLRTLQLEQALNGFDATPTVEQERIIALFDSIDANQTEYETLTASQKDSQASVEGEEHMGEFVRHWDEFQLQYMNLYSSESAAESLLLLANAGQQYRLLSESLEGIIDINKGGASAAALRAKTSYERTRGFIIVMFLGTLVVTAVLGGWLIRTQTSSIKKLEEAARAVAGGDLSVQIEVDSKDEIGNLSRSFNEMTASLSSAQQQLLIKEKMASLGQLIAGIAHEIKNPLNFVNNFSMLSGEIIEELKEELEAGKERKVGEMIAELNELFDDLKFNTEKIEEHGKRADNIVRSMLLHSRGRTGERQDVQLNKFLDEYVNLAFHSMRASNPGASVSVVREYDEDVGMVSIVPQDLGRVIINLINNAFHAVNERYKSERNLEREVKVSTERKEGSVHIHIHDNGTGIPAEQIQRIFEPFFTTKRVGEGTGLGLSLSYDIITHEHKGTLEVESEEGSGSVFKIELPAEEADVIV